MLDMLQALKESDTAQLLNKNYVYGQMIYHAVQQKYNTVKQLQSKKLIKNKVK